MKQISGINEEDWRGSGEFEEIKHIKERYEGWILRKLDILGSDGDYIELGRDDIVG